MRTDNYKKQGKWSFFALLGEHKLTMSVAVILSLLSTVFMVIQPLLIAQFIDSVKYSRQYHIILIFIILLILSVLSNSYKQFLLEMVSESIVYKLRKRLIYHTLRFKMEVIDRHDTADLTSVLTTDTSQLRGILSQGVVDLISQGFTMLFSLFMMIYIDKYLFLVSLIAVILLLFSGMVLGTRTRPVATELQTSIGGLSSEFTKTMRGIRTVRSFLAEKMFQDKLFAIAEETQRIGKKVSFLKSVVAGFSGLALQVMLLTVIGLGALRVSNGDLTIGKLSAFMMYVMLVLTPAAMLSGVLSSIYEGIGSYDRIVALLDEPIENYHRTVSKLTKIKTETTLSIHHLNFAYPSNDTQIILSDLSLDIPNEGMIAIVGPSGGGKTTLFELLERFYDFQDGDIEIFGNDITKLSLEDVRSNLTFIEQNASVFSGTIRENLLVANKDATDEECMYALDAVRLFEECPKESRLDKIVSDSGNNLSGGEKQRLALARAFIAPSKIVLLDESTSNLDSITEHYIKTSLNELIKNRTVVIIAHRLSTIKNARKIYLLKDNQIADSGTHLELLATNEYYKNLVETQLV